VDRLFGRCPVNRLSSQLCEQLSGVKQPPPPGGGQKH
jgi:hypothetical protein